MVHRKKTAFVWSFGVLVLSIGSTSIEVIGLSTNLTSTDNLSEETTAKEDGELSAKHLEPNAINAGLRDLCQNGGWIVHEDGSSYCKCRKGTSGDGCEVVDECANNPTKCGNTPDVQCIYNITSEKVECRCSNLSQQFDSYQKICRGTCRSRKDCFDYEECTGNGERFFRFCRCPWGKAGEKCSEDIDECKRIGRDCGSSSNVECLEGRKKEPVCYCHGSWNMAFNYEAKDCVKCDCGESELGCRFFPGGKKSCFCYPNYYQKDGRCEACNCGYGSNGCKIENGTKVCTCWSSFLPVNGTCQNCQCGSAYGCSLENGFKVCDCSRGYLQVDDVCKECTCRHNEDCSFDEDGEKVCNCKHGYEHKNGFCVECDCGKNSDGCSFKNGEKNCSCKLDYIQFNGTCRRQCLNLESEQCKNGGVCEDSVCQCLSGTHGDWCEIVDECENLLDVYSKCGDNYDEHGVTCAFNPNSATTFCQCKDRNYLFDDYNKKCKECDCGAHGNCVFIEGDKKCRCEKGWYSSPELTESRCEPCKCGLHSTECLYSYSIYEIDCICDLGYALRNGECIDCSCGIYGDCSFNEHGGKVCICQNGYADQDGICTECNCGPNGQCSFDENRERVCNCQPGYADEYGFCVECQCFWDGLGINCTSPSGGHKCTCSKGYEERTENYCTDIDECKEASVCPIGTECKNTLGSYECPCKRGFRPHSDTHKTKRHGCTDIDECEELNKCALRDTTMCIDTNGSYYCECKSGYHAKSSSISIEVEGCKKDQTAWRVGFIIFIVFGIMSFGLIFIICKRRSSLKTVFV